MTSVDVCIVCGNPPSSYTVERQPPRIEDQIFEVTRRYYCGADRCLAVRQLELVLAPHRHEREIPTN